jgi:AcrR family transcriptional regulator
MKRKPFQAGRCSEVDVVAAFERRALRTHRFRWNAIVSSRMQFSMRIQPKSPKTTAPAGSAVLRSDLTRAIKLATLREFAANGYGGFAMEAVARRAGVGKAAVYRRWPSKDAMIIEVLTGAGLEFAQSPDTGSLGGDLTHYVRHAISILRRPLASRIIPHLYAEMNSKTSFGRLVRSTIQPVKRALGGEIVRRAVDRGEIDAGVDMELALDMLAGPLYWRLIVTRGYTGAGYVEGLVRFILAGLCQTRCTGG